eukprot:1173819-Pyramimonas_sp.AAC.1
MPRARTRLAVDVLWLLCLWCGVVQWAGISGAAAQVVEERILWVRTVQVVPTKCPYHGKQRYTAKKDAYTNKTK